MVTESQEDLEPKGYDQCCISLLFWHTTLVLVGPTWLLGPIAKARCRLGLALVAYRMGMGNPIFRSSGHRHGYGQNSDDILRQHA